MEQQDWTANEAWLATRRPIEEASALPAACYSDARFFEVERERVFATSWVCVGLAGELACPPQNRRLLVREVAGRSIIITTDDDGRPKAFHNACRHRGTMLAECDGDLGTIIRCPYHRWAYNLNGSLIATPRFDEVAVAGFDRADYPLRAVRVEIWGGLLFVCLDPNTVPLNIWLGDLPERLGSYRLDEWNERERATFRIEANWKLISENYQEYYHLPWIHPELSKVSRVDDHYRYQGAGMYCGQCTSPVSSEERDDWTAMPPAADLSVSDAASGRFVALFPNVLLSLLPNHAYVMILDPINPGLTIETGAWLLPPTSSPTDAEFATTKGFWVDVNAEDIAIVERGQRGLSSGGYTPGRLSPRFEEPLHRFHNMLADHLTGDGTGALVDPSRIPDGDRADDLDLYGSGINPMPWRPA